jgi:Fe2+ or Zn2+ uptake regulation protein
MFIDSFFQQGAPMKIAAWEQRLARAGYRITEPRRAVMQVLQETDVPLLPPEVQERARKLSASLGLVTVYRTLSLLEEMGLVRRIHCLDGCHGYLPASLGHHHALVCRDCGRAVEFSGSYDIDTLVERVEAETGYRVHDHLLQLFGLCPECQGS